jgi:hypothetical protein
MSNIAATVGRPVQFVDAQGNILAAIITKIYKDGTVSLAVFQEDGSLGVPAAGVKQFDSLERRGQPNTFKLTWQGR